MRMAIRAAPQHTDCVSVDAKQLGCDIIRNGGFYVAVRSIDDLQMLGLRLTIFRLVLINTPIHCRQLVQTTMLEVLFRRLIPIG